MGTLFGTDGIRGTAGEYPMTADIAFRVGQAIGVTLKKNRQRVRAIIGKDTRLSGEMFEAALTEGLVSSGADVIQAGTIPTPAIAFLCRRLRTDCGIVVSASHNPYQDNGIKLFSSQGYKLTDQQEDEIERLVLDEDLAGRRVPSSDFGAVMPYEEANKEYLDFLIGSLPEALDLRGVRIVIDCANGATYRTAPELFQVLGADVRALNVDPDGRNINRECGSTHPVGLKEEVLRHKSDIGLSFDGDGDRVIAVDERGELVTGDKILAVCCRRLLEEKRLHNNCLVHTVMSNLGLSLALKEMGVKEVIAPVGDRYVLQEMKKNDAVLGGEDSGHIIFMEFHTTGDGLLSSLQLLDVLKKERKPLSDLASIMTVFPQVLLNVKVARKPPLDAVPEIVNAIQDTERELGDKGRVLIRYSGTQDLCRIMVEGPTEEETERHARRIADVVQKKLHG